MTNENGDVSGCYVMLTQDRVKPQTIIQQNAAIGTVAVDGCFTVDTGLNDVLVHGFVCRRE